MTLIFCRVLSNLSLSDFFLDWIDFKHPREEYHRRDVPFLVHCEGWEQENVVLIFILLPVILTLTT